MILWASSSSSTSHSWEVIWFACRKIACDALALKVDIVINTWKIGWKLKHGTIDASKQRFREWLRFYTKTSNLLIIGLVQFVVSIFPPKRPKHKAFWYQYRGGAGFYCSSLGKQSNKSEFWWLMFAFLCGIGGVEQKRMKFEAIETIKNRDCSLRDRWVR